MAKDIESLRHAEKELPGGGKVLVLNTGPVISQEAEAMLQALHSRSIGGIKAHLEILRKKGADKFMETFYVGYGHKSIGDCGTCTIFIEGVSMLAAKAIQDWSLYSGQEASTRYIDFAKQPFVDPTGSKESNDILENWRSFYLKGLAASIQNLSKQFPKNEDEKQVTWEKAIKARAFDIMRGFLPSGATTNLAWHTNFRQAADHIMRLRHHPLEEVRNVAEVTEGVLQEAFPSSFGHKRYEATENFNKEWMENSYYYTTPEQVDFELSQNLVQKDILKRYSTTLQARPPKTEVPRELVECGNVQFKFLLDFGSFRDIQRHRAVHQRMPLVTTTHGFSEWYLSELPTEIQDEAKELIAKQEERIKKLSTSPEIAQYYLAMGYQLPNQVTGALPALVYLAELRATRFVHPTLRKKAIQMAKVLSDEFKNEGLVIHLDKDPDRFDVKRGEHDITEK